MYILKILKLSALVLLVSYSLLNADSPNSVRNSFTKLKSALKSGSGEIAAGLVTNETIEIYEQGRKLALSSDGVDFESVLQTKVILIMQLRYLASEAELKKMTGRDVFVWGIAKGLVKMDTLSALELDHVRVEGNEAFATTKKNGQSVPNLMFRFKNQNNRWRLDMLAMMHSLEPAFKEIRTKAGRTKIELAVYLLERTYNSSVPSAILNGPLK